MPIEDSLGIECGFELALDRHQGLGGPLEYARRVGTDTIVGQLATWAQRRGPRFAPSRYWTPLASVSAGQSAHVG